MKPTIQMQTLFIAICLCFLTPSITEVSAFQQGAIEAAFKDENISSEDPAKRAKVWLSIWENATEDDAPVLKRVALEGSPSHARRVAVETMGKLNKPELFLDTVHRVLLNDKSSNARRAAAYSLGLMANERSLEPLASTLASDQDLNVRKRAAASIARIGTSIGNAVLRKALASEKAEEVRVAINWCIENPRDSTMLPRIRRGKVNEAVCNGTRYGVYVPLSYRKSKPMEVLVSIHGSDGTPKTVSYTHLTLPTKRIV